MNQHRTLPTRADFRFWRSETVRWGDMDALGHVNNAVYFQYLESARVGYFEALGRNMHGSGERQFAPVVVSQTFNYRRQVRYPEELEIGVCCTEFRHRSFVLSYAIFRKGSETLLGDGSTVLVWMDSAARRAVEVPEDLRRALESQGDPP